MIRQGMGRPLKSMQDAWTSGSRAAFAATGGKGAGAREPAPGSRSPAWARKLSAGQRLSHAATLTAHTLRDGDRAMTGASPDLKQSGD